MEPAEDARRLKGWRWSMRRFLLGAGLMAAVLAGCANDASKTVGEPIIRLTLQMRGAIETSNPNIRYYVVLNTATTADDPLASASAEATESAGIQPPGGGDPAGPRAYGPLQADYPNRGWDLPFHLSGGLGEGDLRKSRNYQGITPLLPVTWTDYFVLTSENGPLQMIHSQHPQPLTDPDTILLNVATLQQGQDWFVDKNNLLLLLRVSSLINGKDINSGNGIGGTSPLTPEHGRIITANFITSNTQGQIIDRWTLSENQYGVIVHTALSSQDQGSKTRPNVLFPQYKPSVVSEDSMNLTLFHSEIRQ